MNGMHDHGHDQQEPQEPQEPAHNMMVVGEESVYLSHLPMFMTPHNFQVILEATLTSQGKSVQHLYTEDRKRNPEIKMYTLSPSPKDPFKLPTLFTPRPPARSSFKGTVLRGHLERGGEEIDGLADVDVNVKRVIYAEKLTRDSFKPEQLTYILFGSPQELFLAHVIGRPPDFDQILRVRIDRDFTDEELKLGVRVTILDRENTASGRIKEQEKVAGQGHVTGAHQFLQLEIEADVEHYFEEGELSSRRMSDEMFDPTPEETDAGFGN